MYGSELVDAFISKFTPLEWSIHDSEKGTKTAFAKVVVLKESPSVHAEADYGKLKVLGLHIAAPNAGEIIQGFAVSFRKGLTYKVGIISDILNVLSMEMSILLYLRRIEGIY